MDHLVRLLCCRSQNNHWVRVLPVLSEVILTPSILEAESRVAEVDPKLAVQPRRALNL